MIYEVYVDDKLLYYPNDETYSIIDAVVETSLNEAGTFECDVPTSNPRYEEFELRKSMLQVLKDGIEIFNGEIREVTQKFNFTKHIYAVGELAMMFDSIQPQARFQGSVADMVSSLIATHNSQVEDRKKFTVGNILVTDPNNYIYRFTNREDTLTAIRDKICTPLDGYLKVRKNNGVRYLDIVPLNMYGKQSTQEISFGENLLDYSANYTAQDIATCVIPLGVRLNDEQRTADAVEGLDEYLTIKGTTTDAYHVNADDDFVYIQNAVNTFGWVRVVKNWDDVTVAETLKEKAEDWLQDAQFSKMELELNAVDLNLLDHNIESFEVGDTIHCWAEPYNMDTTFPVRKKTTYLNDLSKNYIVLSNTETSKSYTQQASNAVSALKEEIPETFPLLEEAKKKALAMILDSSSDGYVVDEFVYDADGNPIKIATNYCNASTIDASTSRWRFGVTGLGFLERATTDVPWPDSNIPIALLPDGSINANLITAGALNANIIKTGTLNADLVKVHGKIEATSGYIGSNTSNGWNIGSSGVYNGCTGIDDNSNGTYVGTDGIRNQKNGQWSRISGGVIASNGVVAAGSFTCNNDYGNITAGDYGSVYSGGKYKTKEGNSTVSGYSGTVQFVSGGHGISIKTVNGIVTAMAQV